MIVFRYLNREVQRAFIAILSVLFLIAFSQRIIFYVAASSNGNLNALAVVHLLLLFMPILASLLLPLTLFLSILMAYGRLYVEREMDVLHAVGVSQKEILARLMRPVLVLTAVTAIITLWLAPWAIEQQVRVLEEQAANAELALLDPGRFQETRDHHSVIYVRDKNEHNDLQSVFLATLPHAEEVGKSAAHRNQLVSAKSGSHWVNPADGSRYLVLENGWRYEMLPGKSDWTVTHFDRYFVRMSPPAITAKRRKAEAMSSVALIKNLTKTNMSELQWRISLPLSLPILAMFAVPLCRVRPREGKFARVLPGLLMYVSYIGGLMVLRAEIDQGHWPMWLGVWPLHAAIALWAWYALNGEQREYQRKKS